MRSASMGAFKNYILWLFTKLCAPAHASSVKIPLLINSALTLGLVFYQEAGILFPLLLSASGIVASSA